MRPIHQERYRLVAIELPSFQEPRNLDRVNARVVRVSPLAAFDRGQSRRVRVPKHPNRLIYVGRAPNRACRMKANRYIVDVMAHTIDSVADDTIASNIVLRQLIRALKDSDPHLMCNLRDLLAFGTDDERREVVRLLGRLGRICDEWLARYEP